MRSPTIARPAPAHRTARGRRSSGMRAERPPRRIRRIALIAAVLCLVPAAVSYVQALLEPSNSSHWHQDGRVAARQRRPRPGQPGRVDLLLAQRSGQRRARLCTRSRHSPASRCNSPAVRRRAARHYYRPPRIRPVLSPALPGEGVWRATFAHGGEPPPVLITSFRPDPSYPRLVAGVAWINRTRTTTWLYPGRLEPSVSMRLAGPDGSADGAPLQAGGDVQQRLQAVGLRRWIRRWRTHLRPDEARAGHDRAPPQRAGRRHRLDGRSGRRLRT